MFARNRPILYFFYQFVHDRFGKRSDETDQKQSDMEAFMRLQGADDSVSRLSRPRYLNKYPNQICILLIHLEKRLHLLPA